MVKIDLELFKHKYLVENMTISECASFFKCGLNTVARFAKKHELKKDTLLKRKNISKKLRKLDYELIKKLYIKENLNKEQISQKLDVKKGAVSKAIAIMRLKKDKEQKKIFKLNITKQQLEELYLSQNLSIKQLATKFKVSQSCIENRLKKYNIKKSKELRAENYFKNIFDHSNSHIVENKGITELSQITGFSKSFLCKICAKYEQLGKELTIQNLLDMRKEKTNFLEKTLEEKLGIKKYDKKTDLGFNYQPDFKLNNDCYINVDGIYWHSEKFRDNNYHFDMRKNYEDKQKRLFQFLETEVLEKTDIVESIINNILNKNKKIPARKCKVDIVGHKEAELFLENNHLMGSTKAKHLGLFFENQLVCIFSYKKYSNDLKVERFCNKMNITVIGGFSKLLKYVCQDKDIAKIEYWVDLRYGTGNYLTKLGFQKSHDTLGWKWTDFKNVYNRRYCRANMDYRKLSEKQYAEELKLYKIYDAGQRLYTKTIG